MGSSYFALVQFFLQFHTNVMGSFKSREGVAIFEGHRGSGREEVISYSALFVFSLRENRNKNGCV